MEVIVKAIYSEIQNFISNTAFYELNKNYR